MALKHDLKSFLAQPVVHRFMRSEWVGGGINELLFGEIKEYRRVVLTWIIGWYVIIPFNLAIMGATAILPPFATWYTERNKFQQMQTNERVQWGLPFIPFFKYATSALGDLALAMAFTYFHIMPFRDQAERAQYVPLRPLPTSTLCPSATRQQPLARRQ